MRKKGIILLLAIAGLFTACNDAIDITQPGEVSDPYDVFRTPNDVKRGLSNIYIALPGESVIEFDSVFTDEVAIGKGNGGQGLISGEYGFFMQAGNDFAGSAWSSYYFIINRVNRLIEVCDNLAAKSPTNAAAYKSHKAELLGLRAYANLRLFAFYTPDYTNPSGLSIMKLDFVPKKDVLNQHVGRSTVAEIKKFIVDDINEALTLRQTGWVSDNFYYLTDAVLNSFKVKLYAMTGDYNDLLTAYEAFKTNPNYKLGNAQDYTNMFAENPTQPTAEMVWKLARPVGSGGAVASAWYSGGVSPEGSYFFLMGRSLYNALDKLDPAKTGQAFGTRNDVRYDVNVLTGSKVAVDYNTLSQFDYIENDVLLIGKYKGIKGPFPSALKNDIPLIRYSDILLSVAEARAANGQFDLTSNVADDVLNDYSTVGNIIFNIRFKRSNDGSVSMPVINSAQSAWKAILDERRVEFAYEGHRYLDMKRIGAKAGSPGFERYSKDGIVNGAYNLPVNDHRMTLPIPTSELNSNPIVKGQQNPGY